MPNNLEGLFQKIKLDSQTANVSYVYYDKETGDIHKISPKKEESEFEIVEMNIEKVKKLLTGEKKTSDYKVSYDIATKSVILKNIQESNTIFSYDKILYKIPKKNLKVCDLSIEQDFLTNTWKISISNETSSFIKSNNISLYDKFLLSVTKKDDPNILYRSLYIELKKALYDSIKIPFEFDFEFEKREVSIYTNKYFETYSYKVTQ